jgi:hypothetical protein
VIGRLVAAPAVDATPGGGHVATLRITVRDVEEYVLIAFGHLVEGLDMLDAGRLIYAEGCWQARDGAPPELVVDVLTPLGRNRSSS